MDHPSLGHKRVPVNRLSFKAWALAICVMLRRNRQAQSQDISWDDAIARVSTKIWKTRDESWIATEKVDAPDLSVDRASGDRLQNAPHFIPHEGGNRTRASFTDLVA